jgi:CSLREA domain-containing protein
VRARGSVQFGVAALAVVLAVLAVPVTASAVPRNVNTTADGFDQACTPEPGGCTLRDAITVALDGDVVNVPAGIYVLTTGNELGTSVDLTINGAGARQTIISGGNATKLLYLFGSSMTVNGVTLTAGNGNGEVTGSGGAVYVDGSSTLVLNNSAVTNSSANIGGGVYNEGTLALLRTTISGNRALAGNGGGIYQEGFETSERTLVATSTISGNSATGAGGAIYASGGIVSIAQSTIAGNVGAPGAGLYKAIGATGLSNTIVSAPGGIACSGPSFTGTNNVATDASCVVATVANPLLGPLANNGGPTDTHALSASSPAINAANATGCSGTDQRGIARPQGGACDIGAFEYVAPVLPVLTVTTTVVNNDGGEDGSEDFTVAVRDLAGNAVGGSPQPGSATGTAFTLAPGSFRVSVNGASQYAMTIGGACAADGAVAVAENQAVTCTITADDKQPRAGREVAAFPVRGTVRIKKPGGRFRIMRKGDILPNGTIVNTKKGRITLIAPANRKGRETKADFYAGIFKLKQSKGRRPITTLTLTEKLSCARAGKATAAAKKKRKRRLWGNGRGRFRTKGKHSAATVVGTKWLVEDRCKSTLTRVVRGKVSVRDFVKKKTIKLRKGKRYIARAKKR